MKFLFLNGSVRGSTGTTARLLKRAEQLLPTGSKALTVVLTEYQGSIEELAQMLRQADCLLFGTGTYWGSWGSPTQRFLEVMSGYELSDCFLGKPAGAIVSSDSTGGPDLAHRLLGALNYFGCLQPPMASVVLTRTGTRLQHDPDFVDTFQPDDIRLLLANLAKGIGSTTWNVWPTERLPQLSGPYSHAGPLKDGGPLFPRERIPCHRQLSNTGRQCLWSEGHLGACDYEDADEPTPPPAP